MSISVISARGNKVEANASSIAIAAAGGVGTTSPGDLLIVVVCSEKGAVGLSSGWTNFATAGGSGGWLYAAWRIADQSSNDTCTTSFLVSGVSVAGMLVLRGTAGFDSSCIVNHSENIASAAGTTYALSSGLTGVTSGQLTVGLGGFMDASNTHSGNSMGWSGTSWTNDTPSAPSTNGGIGMGDCTTTGTPAVPSVTFSQSFTSKKFIVEAVIKEQVAAGLAGGLFFGMH